MKRFLACCLLIGGMNALHAQCDAKEYGRIITEAKVLEEKGQFISAKNAYEAAKIYACDKGKQAEQAIDRLFEQIERLRVQSDKDRLRADSATTAVNGLLRSTYANDLAFKSKIYLRENRRNAAFRLAEMACKYVDKDNAEVRDALFNALYYNANPVQRFLLRQTILKTIDNSGDIDFSRDGKWLAFCNWSEKSVEIWDLASLKKTSVLQDTSRISCLDFAPDGKTIATGGWDDVVVKVWDIKSGKTITTLNGHTASVFCLAFSPDGKTLATGSKDGTVKTWDAQTGKVVNTLNEYFKSIWCVKFSPDGRSLATGGDSVKIWNLATLQSFSPPQYDHWINVWSVAFSPDGKMLAWLSRDEIIVWDLIAKKVIHTLKPPMVDYYTDVRCIAFSSDSKLLVSGDESGEAKIWDLANGQLITTLKGDGDRVDKVEFSPDMTRIVTLSEGESIKLWNLEAEGVSINLKGNNWVTNCIAYAEHGDFLATGYADGTVKIFDIKNDQTIFNARIYKKGVSSLKFVGNDSRLLSASEDSSIQIISLSDGRVSTNDWGPLNNCWAPPQFYPNGPLIANIASDSTIEVWSIRYESLLYSLSAEKVNYIAFSPDGKKLASGHLDGAVNLWDLESKSVIKRLKGLEEIKFVTFSSDGQLLGIAAGHTAKVWEIDKGTVWTFNGHTSLVTSVAFSPDNKTLATGSFDNTAKIWDIQSEKLITTIEGHRRWVIGVLFSPDGKKLATASHDGITKIWEITTEGIIRRWRETGPQAPLTLSQLQQNHLEGILDKHPGNEQSLIASGDAMEIRAFAELAVSQASGSNILSRVEPNYARADRLYAALLALQDEPSTRMEYAGMLRNWAAVYEFNGLTDKAKSINEKANGIYRE